MCEYPKQTIEITDKKNNNIRTKKMVYFIINQRERDGKVAQVMQHLSSAVAQMKQKAEKRNSMSEVCK